MKNKENKTNFEKAFNFMRKELKAELDLSFKKGKDGYINIYINGKIVIQKFLNYDINKELSEEYFNNKLSEVLDNYLDKKIINIKNDNKLFFGNTFILISLSLLTFFGGLLFLCGGAITIGSGTSMNIAQILVIISGISFLYILYKAFKD